jgi:hypothetical protein
MMNKENLSNKPNTMNEGGREFGHVHDPTQAQQASRNQGMADNSSVRSGVAQEKELKRAREGERKTA